MGGSSRFDFDTVPAGAYWGDVVAGLVVAGRPDEECYTCAAGISPSGVVHFGNFRDIVTSYVVAESLKKKGKDARLLFSWDNFDRLRKVPVGVPASFVEHIGKPLSKVPDPVGCHVSYAAHFQAPFEDAMTKLGMPIEFRDQTALYEAGTYDEAMFRALKKRFEIADILLSFMSEKGKGEKGIVPAEYRDAYYPISLYSRFTGKDNTKILSYDGATSVTYYCADSQKTETVDLSKNHIAKLAWKVDWPMRWKHERVAFEPAGVDHAAPGGSYDVASTIAPQIFGYEAPVFAEYKFVGIQGLGAKMSGSKGNAVSPLELLDIYEPELLKWMYLRKSPNQSFQLAFDTEIYRQYDEYDMEKKSNAIPFRQAVAFGQIVQWDEAKMAIILAEMEFVYDWSSVQRRLKLAEKWLTKYNVAEKISLLPSVNTTYIASMSDAQKEHIHQLRKSLEDKTAVSIKDLEALVYAIPREEGVTDEALKKAQRAFFKDVYNLLIGKDTGPRLGTFLFVLQRAPVLALLTI